MFAKCSANDCSLRADKHTVWFRAPSLFRVEPTVNSGSWDFFCVLEVTLSELTESVLQLDVAKKVIVPKSKLLYFYKQFILPQNIPKRRVHTFTEKLWDNISCERLAVNTLIWLLLSSQLGSLFTFIQTGEIEVVHCRRMDCPKRLWPFGSSEGLISLLLIWSHWAGCVLIWLLGTLMAATLWRT